MASRVDVGAMLGRYRLVERIGGGGMGVVYRAEDPLLGREVAIKIAHSHGPRERDMFLAEARHAASVVHPNLVSIFDLGVHDETGYIAMELVHGTPLALMIRRGPSDWMIAASIGVGVAAGLAALHEARLVHRDVKPANLMLCLSGAVKVVDFGIATSEDGDGSEVLGGSPGYIAPEIILGERARRTADVFSLGVVLHELVIGQRLFDGESAVERAVAVTQSRAPRLPESRAPAWLADLVAACLLQDPAERPSDACEVLAVLRAREPYAELSSVARDLRASSGDTVANELGDEPTAISAASAPLVGRDALVARLVARRGSSSWLFGKAGSGKTRIVSELALRGGGGAVLIVERAASLEALASALGLDSAADMQILRSALRELAPVFVALEDVPRDADLVASLVALVREEASDALLVVTSEHAPSGGPVGDVIELAPLTPGEADQFLAARLPPPRWSLARMLAPLANGHPLSLELLALGIERSDQSLEGMRRGDVLTALVDRALASLPGPVRRIAELLAVASDRGAALIRLHDEEAGEHALEQLQAYGFLERRDHGPALHTAIRAGIVELLARDGRERAAILELTQRLASVMTRIELERRGPAPQAALRALVLLRPELTLAAERAVREPTLPALTAALHMLYTAVEPITTRFDAALPLLNRVVAALTSLGAGDDVLARAYLARARAQDDDPAPSGRDADEAIRRAPASSRLRAEAFATRGSVLKRLGMRADAVAAYQTVAEIADREELADLAGLARWELALGAVRQGGDVALGRVLLDGSAALDAALPPSVQPRIAILRSQVAMEIGDVPRGALECDRALAGARALGQMRFVAVALTYLVETRLLAGDLALAEIAARQASWVARAANTPLPRSFASYALACFALMRGDWTSALRLAHDSDEAARRGSNDPGLLARGEVMIACCLALDGQEGVFPRAERAVELVQQRPRSIARGVEMYAAFARGLAGEAEAFAELDLMLEPYRLPGVSLHEWDNALVARVITVVRAHARTPRPTMRGPHAD